MALKMNKTVNIHAKAGRVLHKKTRTKVHMIILARLEMIEPISNLEILSAAETKRIIIAITK